MSVGASYPNLVVLRTFSKWAGLAGLRIGYGLFPEAVAQHLWKLKPPFNVNQAAVIAVRETLRDREYLMSKVRTLIAERERLLVELPKLEFLKPYPSQANFILCEVVGRAGASAERGARGAWGFWSGTTARRGSRTVCAFRSGGPTRTICCCGCWASPDGWAGGTIECHDEERDI